MHLRQDDETSSICIQIQNSSEGGCVRMAVADASLVKHFYIYFIMSCINNSVSIEVQNSEVSNPDDVKYRSAERRRPRLDVDQHKRV
jgi:hypothetical protein